MSEKPRKLSNSEISERLGGLTGWTENHQKLHRQIEFADFAEAFGFMASVALVAERMNHHPEWSNVWNRVSIDLSTHDVDGISELDFALAEAINKLAPA